MVKGSRTSVHESTDRILLELAKKQYRLLRNIWQKKFTNGNLLFCRRRIQCIKRILENIK